MASTKDEHVDLWRKAQTFEELCELMARWIEGELKYRPGYCGESIASETVPLRDTLAGYNRRGFLTVDSQPAEPLDKHGCGQRAYVMGYASEDLAKTIACLGLHTALLVLIFEPGVNGGYKIPVTVDEFCPFTRCGWPPGFRDLDCFEEDCGEAAMLCLKRAWKVIVIDLDWGREAYLWDRMQWIWKEPMILTSPTA